MTHAPGHALGHALAVRSGFSIGEASHSVGTVIDRAAELGYRTVALVDTMTVSGLPDLFSAAKTKGIKPIIGCTLRVFEDAKYRPPKKGETHEAKSNREFRIKLYARNEAGIKQIFKLLSDASEDEHFYYHARCDMAMIERHLRMGDVVASTGDLYSVFHMPEAQTLVARIASLVETWVEVVPIATPLFDTLSAYALATAKALSLRTMVTYPALYNTGDADSTDVLRAIGANMKMSDRWLQVPYVRDFELADPVALRDRASLLMKREGFDAADIRDALVGTVAFAKGEFYGFDKKKPCLPVMAEDEFAELVRLTREGWVKRFSAPVLGHAPGEDDYQQYLDRLSFELRVLKKMGFAGYFLLVREIVNWSKENGIAVGPGRGSVGGSLVAYLLGITDVDPIRFDLLFERFINPDRLDLPDADLDFMSTRRHEVIQHIEETYGADRVAGISNYSTLGPASALRDISRVHELDPFDYACSKQMEKEHGVSLSLSESAERVPDIDKFRTRFPHIWQHALNLEGAMRNLGRHAAGVVVAGEPIVERAVVERRSGARVVNWDKRTVEDWGLIKIDILGLSTLDTLALASRYIEERHKKRVNFLTLRLDDPLVLRNFAQGHTAGIFQFEGSGMRKVIKDLAESGSLTFDDLVATTALYRPGPLDAGLCDEYVKIKQGKKEPFYEHTNMRSALEPTLGVIIYQEQVMQLVRDIAGFSMTEADHVRKAIGKKDLDKMKKFKSKFVEGASAGDVEVELEDGRTVRVNRARKLRVKESAELFTIEEVFSKGLTLYDIL